MCNPISSIITSVNDSTLTGGNNSTLTAGNYSILTAGYSSVLTSGNNSKLTAGDNSIFCSGENSSFSSIYWDCQRDRTVTFYVGENGIEPNKKYRIVDGKIYDYETGKEVKEENTEEEN